MPGWGFLLTGDLGFIGEADHRTRGARATFAEAVRTADGAAQHQAVSQARAAFERWVQAVHGECPSPGWWPSWAAICRGDS